MTRLDPFRIRALLGPSASPARRVISGEPGVTLPAFVDHHVHMHLGAAERLPAGGIASVLDLGGDPVELARRNAASMPHVAYAGAVLTAPGGYPTGRTWAPPATVREVSDSSTHPGIAGGVGTAVDAQAEFGASVIKISLHPQAGPVFDDDTLQAIVGAAHRRGLPVVAHAEGEGMPQRALAAGVDALAHTPFTEQLDAESIARAVAGGQRWISTIDVHRDDPMTQACAIANLTAFVAVGGRVLYGTDLGNGDPQDGVNLRELTALDAAGLRGAALVATLTDPWPLTEGITGVVTWVAGDPPSDLDEVPTWLTGAAVVPSDDVVRDEV